MKYHCIERTLDITHRGTIVRLWVNLESSELQKQFDIDLWIDNVRDWIVLYQNGQVIQDRLATIPDINAFQIIDSGTDGVRHGAMFYTVPF